MPVVAVTAYAMQGDREKILNSNFDGYLSRPVDARALAQELDRVLRHQGDQEVSADQVSGSKGSGKAGAVREGT